MRPLRVLFVEDSETDAKLVTLELKRGGFVVESQRVQTEHELRAALAQGRWDVVISDYRLPSFDAPSALAVVRQSSVPDTPFIIVSGSIGEESAVSALKAGADDFVVKHNLARLVPAVHRELADAIVRHERRVALDALRDAIRARDEFLSIASHELKTPLTAVVLHVESALKLLKSDEAVDRERLVHRLTKVRNNVRRLEQLIASLLEIVQITQGGPKLSLEPCDLSALVHEAIAQLEEPLRASGSEIAVHARPVHGTWDRERLCTVVANLLANAAKYGDGKPIDVEVDDGGAYARIVVRDRGIGIAETDQERIFERFERAVPERNYGGFGVGLWLSRTVIEAHGGRVRVSSKPGQGSTFTVELPKQPGAGTQP